MEENCIPKYTACGKSQPVGGSPELSGREYYDHLLYCVVFGRWGWGGVSLLQQLILYPNKRQTVTKQFLIRTYMSQLIALPL